MNFSEIGSYQAKKHNNAICGIFFLFPSYQNSYKMVFSIPITNLQYEKSSNHI